MVKSKQRKKKSNKCDCGIETYIDKDILYVQINRANNLTIYKNGMIFLKKSVDDISGNSIITPKNFKLNNDLDILVPIKFNLKVNYLQELDMEISGYFDANKKIEQELTEINTLRYEYKKYYNEHGIEVFIPYLKKVLIDFDKDGENLNFTLTLFILSENFMLELKTYFVYKV